MISLIAAVAQNNVIGSRNDLPWYLPEDLKRFKFLTTGHTVLMGRKTYDSIVNRLHKPLPNRKNIVITSQKLDLPPEVECYSSIDDALNHHQNEDVFIIGGESIFKETMNLSDTLFITEVHKNYDGDVFFPEIDKTIWKEKSREDHEEYSFVEYTKN